MLVFMSLSVWLPVEGSASGLEGRDGESLRSDRLVDQLPHPEMERISGGLIVCLEEQICLSRAPGRARAARSLLLPASPSKALLLWA